MLNSPAMSWYGKLPSTGDFLQRRFPDVLVRQWTQWFQVGLMAWQEEKQLNNESQFSNAPVWNFIVPPMLSGQWVQMGCLLPGRDRVGREYPICAQLAFAPQEWKPQILRQAGNWYHNVGQTLLHAVRNGFSSEQLDQALLAISTPLMAVPNNRSGILDVMSDEPDEWRMIEWSQVTECFDPLRQTSFWWTNGGDKYPRYTHVHSGNFTAQLFTFLFDPSGGAEPGRHSLYPPMFE